VVNFVLLVCFYHNKVVITTYIIFLFFLFFLSLSSLWPISYSCHLEQMMDLWNVFVCMYVCIWTYSKSHFTTLINVKLGKHWMRSGVGILKHWHTTHNNSKWMSSRMYKFRQWSALWEPNNYTRLQVYSIIIWLSIVPTTARTCTSWMTSSYYYCVLCVSVQ
jgi:hypothetical protein